MTYITLCYLRNNNYFKTVALMESVNDLKKFMANVAGQGRELTENQKIALRLVDWELVFKIAKQP